MDSYLMPGGVRFVQVVQWIVVIALGVITIMIIAQGSIALALIPAAVGGLWAWLTAKLGRGSNGARITLNVLYGISVVSDCIQIMSGGLDVGGFLSFVVAILALVFLNTAEAKEFFNVPRERSSEIDWKKNDW